MNAVKKTTLIDRLRAAINAFRGKPIGHIIYGLEIKECRKCEYRNECAAVEVVRCRECKEWKHGLCRLLCADTPEDGYCFCGEMMDGGADDAVD